MYQQAKAEREFEKQKQERKMREVIFQLIYIEEVNREQLRAIENLLIAELVKAIAGRIL